MKEGAGYAQAAAQQIMAEAYTRKVAQMEEQNFIMLMTLPSRIDSPEAQEYLRLRQSEELKKLRRRLAEDQRREEQEDLIQQREKDAAIAAEAATAAVREEMRRQIHMPGGRPIPQQPRDRVQPPFSDGVRRASGFSHVVHGDDDEVDEQQEVDHDQDIDQSSRGQLDQDDEEDLLRNDKDEELHAIGGGGHCHEFGWWNSR